MFVGLGQQKHTFEQPHAGLNIFLGKTPSHGKPKEYCYLGVYTAVRVNGLSVDEWRALSDEVEVHLLEEAVKIADAVYSSRFPTPIGPR